jgi:hypothetical protein
VVLMVKGKQVGFKPSGRIVVVSKNDKKFCKHENLVKYCIRDGYQYYFCLDCKNLVREIFTESVKIKRGDGNE